MRTCRQCLSQKPSSDFYKDHAKCKTCFLKNRAKHREKNRDQINARKRIGYQKNRQALCQKTREWRIKNPDKHREMGRVYRQKNKEKIRLRDVRWRYGVAPEQYQAAMKAQQGKCAICGAGDSGKRSLHVDHCHATGAFRGLLCSHCNTALGKFKESADLLMKAIKYITFHKSKAAS